MEPLAQSRTRVANAGSLACGLVLGDPTSTNHIASGARQMSLDTMEPLKVWNPWPEVGHLPPTSPA